MASKENNVYSRFSFCGKVTVSKKVPFVKRDTYDKGEKISINFGIKAGNNLGYVKLEGFKNDEIKTMDIDRNNIEVAWSDRLDEDVIKTVASTKKVHSESGRAQGVHHRVGYDRVSGVRSGWL